MVCFFFQAEDGIRDRDVTGVQTCALPISQIQSQQQHGSPVATGSRAHLFADDPAQAQNQSHPHSTTSSSRDSRTNAASRRSEEHTSELQSHHDLVCRLLLEKKKKKKNKHT